jgi:hypothetical protein
MTWLGNVGISRYDSNFGLELGPSVGIQDDQGNILTGSIKDCLKEFDHAYVLLKGDTPIKRKNL